jgi:hypothetical protein
MIDTLYLRWQVPNHDYTDAVFVVGAPFRMAGLNVPTGFKTDGGSMPRGLRWVFSPVGRYLPAAIVHDLAIHLNPYTAAHVFRLALKEQGVSTVVRWSFYTAVKVYWSVKLFFRPRHVQSS